MEQRLETATNLRPTNRSTDDTFSKLSITLPAEQINLVSHPHKPFDAYQFWYYRTFLILVFMFEFCYLSTVRRDRIVVKSALHLRHVCPPVCIHQRGSLRKDLREGWYWRLLFKKKLSESKFCWKSHKHFWHFTQDSETFHCCRRYWVSIKALSSTEMVSDY
jgi:hypothetical protein